MGIPQQYKYYSNNFPIYMNHGHLRDFDFFDIKFQKLPKSEQELRKYYEDTGFEFDDFIFGITDHKLFVSRYRVNGAGISCFTEDGNTFVSFP